MTRRAPSLSLTLREYELATAWWKLGGLKEAGESLGMSEQTAKNTILNARRRMGVSSNAELIKAVWRQLNPRDSERLVDPNEYRRLRYQFDAAYREKSRKQAKEGMRKKRALDSGFRQEAFDRLILEQDGKCAICGSAEDRFRKTAAGQAVRLAGGHDHTTGAVRALLCTSCNMMLGCANDRAELLDKGAEYLRRHAQGTSHKKDGKSIDLFIQGYESYTPEKEQQRQDDLAERWREYEANR